MKIIGALFFVLTAGLLPASAATDASHVDVYVTPWYDSNGPAIRVGTYSAGLASKDERTFLATIRTMKSHWNALRFDELYVGAIRLYDLGYRNESVYWFYTAQYRGRQFAELVDQNRLGEMGSPGFELYHAQNAFFTLTGPYFNGYAFGNPDALVRIVRRVQSENRSVGNLRAMYPGVAFTPSSTWRRQNAELNAGMDKLVDVLTTQKDAIKQQRKQNGSDVRFGSLTSKDLPAR